MSRSAPSARRRLLTGLLALGAGLGVTGAALAKLETWRQESSSAFTKGRRERVVVTEEGAIRLGRAVRAVGKIDAAHVWDLARTDEGVVYAATGDAGKVFRLEGGDDPRWVLAYDSDDTQALCLAVGPDGHVFVGTGPSGRVVDVTAPKQPGSRPAAGVQYIWDLAADAAGNLYAATGPTGQLWKRSPDGRWSLLLDSKHPHLLCVAAGRDGAVYAGSDGEGLIYKVAADWKVSVLYDAPQSEVRSLLIAPDGSLYAGTAAEAGGGGSGRGSLALSDDEPTLEALAARGAERGVVRASTAAAPRAPGAPDRPSLPSKPEDRPRGQGGASGGTGSPRPISAGDNAVYRIDPEGIPREVFRAKALIYALAWLDDRLLVGTGPEGQLFEVSDLGRDAAPVARLDGGQVLSLLAGPDGALLGCGDPGGVVRLSRGYVDSGTLMSEPHDTKLISRFGALTWKADLPQGTSVALQVRSGNVGEPDDTWSRWSAERTEPDASTAGVPPGRFVQYRVTLRSRDPKLTPEVRSVSLRYQSANVAPEVVKLDVPDLAAGDGATRQAKLNLRWEASDPNGDDLEYTLQVRKDGWPAWVRLGGESPLTESSYAWDTTTVPSGIYRLRLSASDRPSNNPDVAQSRERDSEPFVVDHEPPAVTVTPEAGRVAVVLKDNLTRIAGASYSVDGGEWVAVFPEDRLFDTSRETITITLARLKPGPHVVVVRANDAAGNLGSGDALIKD